MTLFADGPAPDSAYRNIRDARDGWLAESRTYCDELWARYVPYADTHFREEIRRDFFARFWEMYLTVALEDMGFAVTCPKPGPDVGIEVDGRWVWFEAVSPKPGSTNNPDRVDAPVTGRAYWVPNDRIVLRYLNAIRTKYTEQYSRWLADGIVGPDDCFVIAINPRELHFEHADTEPPRILQAALPLGDRFVTFAPDTLEVTGGGHRYRAALQRASGAEVPTGAFLNPEYPSLSGLLCSRVDAAHRPPRLGDDFQLVTNPLSGTPLPGAFRLRGTYFAVEIGEEEVTATAEQSEHRT